MGKSAGQIPMLTNALTPTDWTVREFKCGVTNGLYEERLALKGLRKQTFAIQAIPATSRGAAAGATVAIATGADMATVPSVVTLFNQNGVPPTPNVITGSFLLTNESNFLGYNSGLTPLNRCFAVFGLMVHARRCYVRFQALPATLTPGVGATTGSIAYVPEFLTSGEDGYRMPDQVMHDMLETMSIRYVEPVSGKFFDLGNGMDNPDIIAGFDVFKGRGRNAMYMAFGCPLIAGSAQTIDAPNVTVTTAESTQYETDGTNAAGTADGSYNTQGDGTAYFEFTVYIVGATICCPPDKLCEFDAGSIGLGIGSDATGPAPGQ